VSGNRTSAGAARVLAGAAVLALAGAAGCGRPPARLIVDPPDGISIAVYRGAQRGFAVIDDRRTIEVTGRQVLLDRIERGAALPTLVLEPLGAARGALAIGPCAREQLRFDPADAAAPAKPAAAGQAGVGAENVDEAAPSPLLACTVTGAPGRHRVRVHYVAAPYGFKIRHEIAMAAPDRATVSTRLIVPTPAWGGARGELALYDGVPGSGDPPREVGRGMATLDGGIAVIALPPREVPARLVRVFEGMVRHAGIDRTDLAWGKDSHHNVVVMLELDDAQLLPAPAHVRISLPGGDPYEVGTAYGLDAPAAPPDPLAEGDMATRRPALSPPEPSPPVPQISQPLASAGAAPAADRPKRLSLWTDPLLRGMRRRFLDRSELRARGSRAELAGTSLVERFELTVSNQGGEPREVWIEEPLRPARRRELSRARPAKPELSGDVARLKVVVGPGQIERVGFTVRYTF
jgi:hypothetical protein